MKISVAGLDRIGRFEGCVLHVYNDAGGKPTIGFGHLLRPGESFPGGITHDQAVALLARDVGTAEDAVNRDVKVALSQNQFDALVSFAFNCGTGALAYSLLLSLLNQGDVDGAADQFLRWDHVGGEINDGLLARRNEERKVFLTPDQPAVA